MNLTAEVNKLATIALGPDVADPKTLDPKSLVTLRVSDYLHQWEKNPVLEIPAQWWRPWLGFRICLTGKVNKCFPLIFEKTPLLRSMALGNVPYHLPWEICSPICNGVVEVWESTCCCFPFLLVDVPPFIEKLKHFLAQNPVMFPHPPRPGPITPAASRTLETSVDRAIAQGKTDLRFTPNTQLHLDLQVLESSSPAEAVQHFQTHPSLWPIWCECSSTKLGETAHNPDGTFQFCYWQFLFPWLFCWRSYFYKVKQFQNGSWVYIYDGAYNGIVKGIFSFGMNPVGNGPHSKKMIQALSKLDSVKVDLFVIDIMMPQVDGLQVLSRFKHHPLLGKLPVIICSVLPQKNLAASLGAIDFIQKPIQREAFISTLGAALGCLARLARGGVEALFELGNQIFEIVHVARKIAGARPFRIERLLTFSQLLLTFFHQRCHACALAIKRGNLNFQLVALRVNFLAHGEQFRKVVGERFHLVPHLG